MKNPFQHGLDYILGRCRCPGCNIVWGSYMLFDDMLCFSGTDKNAEKRWSCPTCGMKKDIVIWKKTNGKWQYIYKE